MRRIKKWNKSFLIASVVLFLSVPAFAGFFDGDTFLLGKLISMVASQSVTLEKSLNIARNHLGILKNLFGTVGRAFAGIDLPQDFIPWDQEIFKEMPLPNDPRLDKILDGIRLADDVTNGKNMRHVGA